MRLTLSQHIRAKITLNMLGPTVTVTLNASPLSSIIYKPLTLIVELKCLPFGATKSAFQRASDELLGQHYDASLLLYLEHIK
jgi:hypothetical protein